MADIIAKEPPDIRKCASQHAVECPRRYYPITCPDDGDERVFRTDSLDGTQAVISFRWSDDSPGVVAIYRMVRIGKMWLLDEAKCANGVIGEMA